MRTLRVPLGFLILSVYVAGCASTAPVAPEFKTVASVGDRQLPVVTGEPGTSVAADQTVPERSRDSTGRISGRVVDESGSPVPGVRVRLGVGSSPGGKVITAKTDRTGAFTLRGVRPGASYTVIAEWEDDRDHLTGRSVVRAPDTDVRIALAQADTDLPGAINASAGRKVRPVSERDQRNADDEFSDEPPSRRSKVNDEDLPPPPEAEAFAPTRSSRTAARGGRDASPRVARWRPGGSEKTTDTDADESDSDTRAIDRAASAGEPKPTVRNRPQPAAAGDEEDEDGPNPLPPARERAPEPNATTSKAEPERPSEPLDALAQTTEEPAALPEIIEPPSSAAPAHEAAEVDRTSLAIADGLPSPVEAAATPRSGSNPSPSPTVKPRPNPEASPFEELGSPMPAPAPPVVAAAVPTPSQPDQSIFDTEPSEHSAKPSAPPADRLGKKRQTWQELAAAPTDATQTGAGPRAAAPGGAQGWPVFARAPAPRAAPRQPDDGKAYCDYDPKLRKINDFRLPDLEGRLVRFQDLDADLVLLDFWGTWCHPCVRAVPHLVELQDRIGSAKLKVVGVACEQDPPADRPRNVAQAARRLKINYPVLLSGMDGPCPLQQALQIQAYPTLVLVDRQGRIVWRDQGATPVTLARLDRFLAASNKSSDTVRRY